MSHLRLAEGLADVAELRATIAVVVRIAEHVPVRLDVGEAHRVALRNLFEAHVDDRGMTRMTSDLTHVWPPLVAVVRAMEIFLVIFMRTTMSKSVYPLAQTLSIHNSPRRAQRP